jgi:hypothetical protein
MSRIAARACTSGASGLSERTVARWLRRAGESAQVWVEVLTVSVK